MDPDGDGIVLNDPDSVAGAKQMYSKILLDMFAIDEPCAQRVIDMWKQGLSVTRQLRNGRPYISLEEYIPYRTWDTAARLVHSKAESMLIVLTNIRFVLAMMLFGAGIAMTDEEFADIEDVAFPAYAALGLANDYFSFDREYAEREESSADAKKEPLVNAVWLCMEWSNMDVAQAKELVRTKILFCETEYLSRKSAFLSKNPGSEKFRLCFDGISYIVSGNIIWSLTCPRYNPERRYDANAGVETQFLGLEMPSVEQVRAACLETKRRKDSGTHFDELEPTKHGQPATKQDNILSSRVVTAPFEYCAHGSSKETRSSLIDALNVWIRAPFGSTKTIKAITTTLHTASLLLDDIEDQSPLRRGKPAAHTIFGTPSTINSANFAILEATEQASGLGIQSLTVYFNSLRKLFIGQSHDLFWTKHNTRPSPDEYLTMVDGKTGGLFQLSNSLLICNANPKISPTQQEELQALVTLIGRFYQIRDDLKNLTSAEYAGQKGACEDLDEGKFSYPLILALAAQEDSEESTLRSAFAMRSRGGKVSPEMKRLVLDEMRACGALDRTEIVIDGLRAEIEGQVGKVEGLFGRENWVLRLLLFKLR